LGLAKVILFNLNPKGLSSLNQPFLSINQGEETYTASLFSITAFVFPENKEIIPNEDEVSWNYQSN